MNSAKRLSIDMCKETCPALEYEVYTAYEEICKKLNLESDKQEIVHNILIDTYCEKFKDVGTHLLRDALNTACENILSLEDKLYDTVHESNTTISKLEDKIDDLEYIISELESKL